MSWGEQVRLRTTEDDEDAEQARYDEIYAALEAEQREEYDREFDQAFREKHPFKANAKNLHAATMVKIREEKQLRT